MDIGYTVLAILIFLFYRLLLKYYHQKNHLKILIDSANVYKQTCTENEQLKNTISCLHSEHDRLIKENTSLNEQLSIQQRIKNESSNEQATLELNMKCLHYETTISNLTNQIRILKAHKLEHENTSNTSAQSLINSMDAKIKRLQSDCDHYHETLSKIGPAYTTLQHEYRLLQDTQSQSSAYLSFLLESFPSLKPYLETYIIESNTLNKKGSGNTASYLKKEDYELLNHTELLQLALDRYIASHKKTDWQIGRDYELSVGHEYIQQGYRVDFTGISEKYNDLGRDIIAYKGRETRIIQCKHWGKGKSIQEKHISQLYGTCTYYRFEHPNESVIPVFITNVRFSATAKRFAQHLGVELHEMHPLSEFPRIKCNIRYDTDNGTSMIFHLPMDPQYDRVKIDSVGECFAYTVAEAESYGFRHAEKN